jgi:hypothetical protein
MVPVPAVKIKYRRLAFRESIVSVTNECPSPVTPTKFLADKECISEMAGMF